MTAGQVPQEAPELTASARFVGKTAIVSAAGSGIGRASALRLAGEGAHVLVTDIDAAAAARVSSEINDAGGQSQSTGLDARDPDDWAQTVLRANTMFERIDVLILNAGRNEPGRLEDLSDTQWSKQLRLCLDSAFYGMRALLPALQLSHGAIVLTSSIHALVGFPSFPAYAAAKGAMVSLTRQLAVDNGDTVRINTVLPGAIKTPLWTRVPEDREKRIARLTPMRRLGRPEEVAAAITFLASSDASYITGQAIVVDGGRTAASHET